LERFWTFKRTALLTGTYPVESVVMVTVDVDMVDMADVVVVGTLRHTVTPMYSSCTQSRRSVYTSPIYSSPSLGLEHQTMCVNKLKTGDGFLMEDSDSGYEFAEMSPKSLRENLEKYCWT
jgi:hypothetical protein